MAKPIDPRIRALAESIVAKGGENRVVLVLKTILKQGSISTDELAALGYGHPPRAAGDVKDAGIPIIKTMVRSERTGRRMAVYSFGDPDDIQEGRIGGRSAFPKTFKNALIERYGSIDCITGATLDERILQIDHRIPYRIAGDANFDNLDVEDFMLLDGSSQRAKSWSCEHCPNMLDAQAASVCKTCYWAFPENYEHIATEDYRRTDITWQGDDVPVHDRFKKQADKLGISVAELLRRLARQSGKLS